MRYISGDQRRLMLMDSAKQLFWDKGYENTSLNEIAKTAKTRQSLMYYYFKNKKELAILIYAELSEKMECLLQEKMEHRQGEISDIVFRGVYVAATLRAYLTYEPLGTLLSDAGVSCADLNLPILWESYKNLMEESPGNPETLPWDIFTAENLGFTMTLVQMYWEGGLHYTHDELIGFKIVSLLRSIFIEGDALLEKMKEICEIEKTLHFEFREGFEVELIVQSKK